MSSSSTLPTPEGPGSVSGAPHLTEGFTGTFTSRYIDTEDVRLHAVIGGDGPPLLLIHGWLGSWYYWRLVMPALAQGFEVLDGSFQLYRAFGATAAQNEERKTRRLSMPVLAMGGAESSGVMVADTMKLIADDVQTLVIPGIGHWLAEQAPDEMVAALTAFLAPYRDGPAAAANPRPHAAVD
jgi:pimeloyl-ACP methyl ester carboxylesterase